MKSAKRVFSFLLAICAVLSFVACGAQSADSAAGDSAKNAEATTAPEYVYTPSFTTLVKDSENGIAPLVMTDSGLYYADAEKVGEAIPEGVTPEFEGQYDINEFHLFSMDFEGNTAKLEEYVPLASEITAEGKRDYYTLAHPEAAVQDDNGDLVLLEQVYTSWSEAPAEIKDTDAEYFDYAKSVTENYIRVVDSHTGREISVSPIALDEDAYISGMFTDKSGNIAIICEGSGVEISVFSTLGDPVNRFAVDGYIYSAAKLTDGGIAALIYEFDIGMSVKTIDTLSGKLSAKGFTIPDSASQLIYGSGDYDFYYSTDAVLYGFKLDGEVSEVIFNWVDCDVNVSDVGYINIGNDGTVYAISAELSKDNLITTDLIRLEKTPYEQAPQKQHLTLATVGGAYELYNNVVKFNRQSDKYHIDVKDYYELTGTESYSDAQTKLLTEIAAGVLPDILDTNINIPYTRLAAKGLLVDLYPYIDADSELERSDFFANILAAYEVDGKLCAAVPGFGVMTLMGASAVVGDEMGWTYDAFNAALATMPEGCTALDWYFTRETMLNYCLAIDLDSYMNWSSGECRFDSDEFKALLQFCAQFPSNEEMENYEPDAEDAAEYRIAHGMQMLSLVSLATFNETGDSNPFGTDVTYIGFPNGKGDGGCIITEMEGYAITSACKDKDAAWQFVRTFFTEDYQRNSYYFPTNKNAFDYLLNDAKEIEYERDSAGHILLDENGEKKRLVIGMTYDGTTYRNIYSGLSEDTANAIVALVNAASRRANFDDSISNIVLEGAQGYFAGQKSLDETAKLIQSKANIYVNEQR